MPDDSTSLFGLFRTRYFAVTLLFPASLSNFLWFLPLRYRCSPQIFESNSNHWLSSNDASSSSLQRPLLSSSFFLVWRKRREGAEVLVVASTLNIQSADHDATCAYDDGDGICCWTSETSSRSQESTPSCACDDDDGQFRWISEVSSTSQVESISSESCCCM